MMFNYNVLFVDDEPMLLKSINRSLMDEEYTVFTAESGTEALALMQDENMDIVISDQNMPGMSGLAFLEKVKINYPHILTIMMTAHSDIQIAVKAINEAGVYKFVLKPFEAEDLKITIQRGLETLQLIKERDTLLQQVKARDAILKDLETEHPGITQVERDDDGFIVLS
ncbi:response regulator [Desulfococcaceae bacterium HSG7]|nr:response regulator [Desulfococcaceae bacterium HSG9]MDM8554727.1 response regulator [Desulfococcaceae bacterium HSG7]